MPGKKKGKSKRSSGNRQRLKVPAIASPSTEVNSALNQSVVTAEPSGKPTNNDKQDFNKVIAQPQSRWRELLFKHIPLWALIVGFLGLVVAPVAILVAYRTSWSIQSHNEELATSKITYAFFISPAPAPGEQFETTTRWAVKIMIANAGPKTAQTFVLNLHTPDPQRFLHSEPSVMSSPAAAEVQINKRIPEGIYQVVFKNFVPGDTCFLQMFYRTTDEEQKEFMDSWEHGGMFAAQFGKRFVQQFFFTGENLKVENQGSLDLKPLNEASEKPQP